jgi:transcriptional regulator with XRE-family HTH domain
LAIFHITVKNIFGKDGIHMDRNDALMLTLVSPGERIKFYRKKEKLTQKKLAAKVGIDESTLRNYELNNRNPSYDIAVAIADALHVHINAIWGPQLNGTFGAMHALFELEKLYNLRPVMINGIPYLQVAPHDGIPDLPEEIFTCLPDNSLMLMKTLMAWHHYYSMYESGEITEDEYLTWESKYPNFVNLQSEDLEFIDGDASRIALSEDDIEKTEDKKKAKNKKSFFKKRK